MKRIAVPLLLLGVVAALATAQDDTEAKYKAKLEKSFAKKIPWELDFQKAMEKARAQKKLIMGYFTRSYAP